MFKQKLESVAKKKKKGNCLFGFGFGITNKKKQAIN